MTDWTQEEDEAFNDVEKHSNLGKQILREIGQPYHFQKREWVGLTEEDLKLLSAEWRIVYGAWMDDFARDIEAKLKEKNEKT
jgi:hypothetical protein